MELRLAAVVGSTLALLVAGCGGSQTSRARERGVTPSEWKSVIRDSYDGKIDHPYRCAAVHEAIERVPHDTTYFGAPGTASGALIAFEKRVC